MSAQEIHKPLETHRTHEVKNQPSPLSGYNAFTTNRVLVEALEREGGGWAKDKVSKLGEISGGIASEWGERANENPPKLHTHDRFGNRWDYVEFHPNWHDLMRTSVEFGIHALPWQEPRPGAHVARAAMMMTMGMAEAGHICPISMTYSAIPALRVTPEVAKEWEPKLASGKYDGRLLPSSQKTGCIAGMAMTEKQGGSDVRANTTVAKPITAAKGPGAEYALTGHKWFCSAPMSDVFLVLAQAPGGLSCFAVPRFLPDGTKNVFNLQRLKDKLGNRSNASSEVEFDGTWGRMVGEEGRGVPTIIEMVNHTRLDCVLGSAAGMRLGVVYALHWTANRSAFGRVLNQQPLMMNVLADLCVEAEAGTVTAMRLARAYDEAARGDARQQQFRRIATAIMKYWTCKRGPAHAHEAMECLGGSGYVEASGAPRLYREAPLNGIWEGSGNVICLDVLRALAKEPSALDAFVEEVELGATKDRRVANYVDALKREFEDLSTIEVRARNVVEKLALALQASLLVRHGNSAVTEAFIASRLNGDWGHAFGTLPPGTDFKTIIERHQPV
ncbi:MAG: acyl-CoA dehydrogenase family protein [Myxococcaceae bacterium]